MLEVFFDCAESRQRWLDPYFFSVLTDEKPEERYSAVAGLYRVSPTEIAIGASHARAHSTVAPTTTEWLPSREAFVSSFFFSVSLLLSNPATGSTAAGPSPFRFVSFGVAFYPPVFSSSFFRILFDRGRRLDDDRRTSDRRRMRGS